MKLIRYPQQLNQTERQPCIATIGNFDGVHAGHRQIINQVIELATSTKGFSSSVISFEPLPNEYFSEKFGKPAPGRIYPLRDKVLRFNELGIDELVCMNFDEQLAEMRAEDFVSNILLESLKVQHLIIGDDFRFGKNRKGDLSLLQNMGKEAGMTAQGTSTITDANQRISSSRIREHLAAGQITAANRLLGHSYRLTGRVRHGDKRGRTIGFPTLNMRIPENMVAARGVYAVRIHDLSPNAQNGVANLGTRPTVAGNELRLETHVFDYSGDVYGKHVSVELLEFLRPEQKFEDFDALLEQIKTDSEKARQLLS